MIVGKIINAIENTELEIIGITLLSAEEVEKLPIRLRKYSDWWWLRSSGCIPRSAAFVLNPGAVCYTGVDIYNDLGCIRTALIINLNSSSFKVGDCFIFADKEFEIISDSMAFCKSDIGFHRFDKISNDYETSEIKNYINNWFENKCIENWFKGDIKQLFDF